MELQEQGNPYKKHPGHHAGHFDTKKKKKRKWNKVHPKVAAGGSAALIVAGLLQVLSDQTGIDAPEGTAEYIVALAGIVAGYIKSSTE